MENSDADKSVALLKTFQLPRGPLPAEDVCQHSKAGFGQHLIGSAGRQSRSHRSFESAEEAFGRPAPLVTLLLEVFFTHQIAPFAAARPVRSVVQWFDDALYAPMFPAMNVDPFGIVATIGIQLLRLGHRL